MSQRKRYDTQTWEYEFQARGQTYRRSGYETLKDCRAAEAQARNEVQAKALREPGQSARMTLSDYVELWKGDHVKANCRATTAKAYLCNLKHVLPAFGHVPLVDLRKADIRAHFARLTNSGMARNSVRNVLVPLRGLLNLAVDDGLISSNPAIWARQGRARARTEGEAAKVVPYSSEELDAILAVADEHEPDYATLFHTLARSGLREAEGLGLQPRDIHEDHLWVRRNVQWLGRDLHVFAAKSGQTRRVDIPRGLAQRIKAAAATSPGPYIFGGAEPTRPAKLRRAWHRILGRTNEARDLLGQAPVERKNVHDLRHTYAGILLAKGAPPKYVQEQLGHSSIKVTFDTYGHLIPGTNRKWVDDTF